MVVANITTCKDVCKFRTVCQGYAAHVNVTVANLGTFTETFNVTAYANSTVIGSHTVSSLAAGTQAVAMFLWNTSLVHYAIDNYTLSAHADVVSGDANATNNDFTDGIVKVTGVGDVNGDNKAEMKDIGLVARAYGAAYGDSKYNPNADINDDHKCEMKDIGIIARNYGKTYS